MTDSVDCKWIENNLEALFCERLEPEQDRLAREHIEACASCRREVQALNAIDPLVQQYFRRELAVAQGSRIAHRGRAFGLSAAAVAIVALVLFAVVRTPETVPVAPSQPAVLQPPAVAEIQAPPSAKTSGTENASAPVERTKPANEIPKVTDGAAVARPASSEPANAPDFLVMDSAGYSHRLAEFRGHMVVIAVWSGAPPDAVANFERLYKAHGSDSRFRFLGVSNARSSKPANTTFPVFYNKGSKVLGVPSGGFVLLDENGGVTLRGSLVKDIENLRKALQGN